MAEAAEAILDAGGLESREAAAGSARLRITEIFLSLQGESSLVGWPTVFVRLTGCPLRCGYCDTAYAFHGGQWLALGEILEQVRGFGVRHVCVTGGEPLAQRSCPELLRRLCDQGLRVSLETSGALDIGGTDPRLVRVVDVKTPGSGEVERNRWANLDLLRPQDEVKFVLCSRADYDWAREVVGRQRLSERCGVLFSPSFTDLPAARLAEWIIADRLAVRLGTAPQAALGRRARALRGPAAMTGASSRQAVVLLSGGLDSATVLAIARSEGYDCHALSVAYGQRHAAELAAAEAVARAHGASAHLVLRINLDEVGGSALTDRRIQVPEAPTTGIPSTYVPARNTVFLSLALGWAEVLSARDLFIGVNAVDYSGYPDCRPEFVAAFQQLANLATRAGVEGQGFRIHTPLIGLSKAEIIRRGVALGVDYAGTVSCYQPDPLGLACGRCDACRLRREGFEAAGLPDPTRYQSTARRKG